MKKWYTLHKEEISAQRYVVVMLHDWAGIGSATNVGALGAACDRVVLPSMTAMSGP
jgi:hypothetical protein